MSEIPVFVLYDGWWEQTTKKFVGSKCKGILIQDDITYTGFLEKLFIGLEVDSTKLDITMKIGTSMPECPLMALSNDDDIRFFICLMKKGSSCPLYASIVRKKEDKESKFSGGSNHFSREQHVAMTPLSDSNVGGEDLEQSQEQYNSVEGLGSKEKVFSIPSELASGDDESGSDIRCSDTSNDPEQYIVGDGEIMKEDKSKEKMIGGVKLKHLFCNKEHLYKELSLIAIRENFQFKVEKSTVKSLVVRCLDEQCNWRLRAAKLGKSEFFEVREYNNAHTCSLDVIKGEHRQATSWLVEECIKSMFGVPGLVYKPDEIVLWMKEIFGVNISYEKACKARESVVEANKVSPDEPYAVLPSYCAELKSKNPGTAIHIETDDGNRFKSLFMALAASIKGWLECRPVIAIDGSPMEAYGTLFVATCKDGNNQLFPLALGIVDSENDASWEWFLAKFKEAFGNRDDFLVISKHTESICKAINNVYPDAQHAMCTQHLLQNINAKFKEVDIELLLYNAAKSYQVSEFEKFMCKIQRIDERIHAYLLEVGYEKWASAYFTGKRYNIMTTETSEFLTEIIEELGELPAIAVACHWKDMLCNRFPVRRFIARYMMSLFTKWAEDELRNKRLKSLTMKVSVEKNKIFRVNDEDKSFMVDLLKKTCTCREFDLDQMTCAHALAVLKELNVSAYLFCSKYYTVEALEATYKDTIHPSGRLCDWKVSEEVKCRKVLPPTTKWSGGRPKRERTPFLGEEQQIRKCSKCGERGHNRQTCDEVKRNSRFR